MAVANVLLLPAAGRFRPRIPLAWASMSPPSCYQRISSANTASGLDVRIIGPRGNMDVKYMERSHLVCRVGRSDISHLELGRPQRGKEPEKRVIGVFWIILLNLGLYAADHLFKFPWVRTLYLFHGRPQWYQFITSTFCHSSWEHLSGNLFFLYIFGIVVLTSYLIYTKIGKLVEEEEGNLGLWISYIITGVGANLVSWLVLPSSAVSMGASGAVFGLFAISVLVKLSWDWRKILEVLILGQFVVEKVIGAAQASTNLIGSIGLGMSFGYVNHVAHLSGALVGAALVYLVSRIPSQSSHKD